MPAGDYRALSIGEKLLLWLEREPGSGDDDWTLQSDHGEFHQAGVPFVYFGVEDHPDYHKATDHVDKLLPELMQSVTRLVFVAVFELAAAPPK